MKKNHIYIKPTLLLLCPVWLLLLSSCLKKNDVALNHGAAAAFSGKDIVQTLAAESSLKLFYQAFTRLAVDKDITAGQEVTIFALTDSAMMAAGLDAATINKLSADSLRKLITYQVVSGSFTSASLINNVTASQLTTLKVDTITTASGGKVLQYEQIFVKLQGNFYFNGVPVSQSKAGIQATNGFIYPVSGLASHIPSRTLLDIINADPDLSMYRAALAISDSLGAINGGGGGNAALFGAISNGTNLGMMPTILAPTNKAFYDAGFHNAQDLTNLATRYYSGYDPNNYVLFIYPSLDSVLNHHLIYDQDLAYNQSGAVCVFYNDLLSPAINNNVLNNYLGGPGYPTYEYAYLKYPVPLYFTASGGTAIVKWTNDPAAPPVTLPRDASPQHSVNNFIATNGALYKIDKLFYPIAK